MYSVRTAIVKTGSEDPVRFGLSVLLLLLAAGQESGYTASVYLHTASMGTPRGRSDEQHNTAVTASALTDQDHPAFKIGVPTPCSGATYL